MSGDDSTEEVNARQGSGLLVEAGSDAFRLANNQELIWLGQRLAPNTPLYEVVYTYTISGEISTEVFQSAFLKLVGNVSILRTVASDPVWREALLRGEVVEPTLAIDLSQEPDATSVARLYVAERMQSKLNPVKALYDSVLLKLDRDQFLWYLKLHHSLTDAANGGVMLQAMSDHYAAELEGGEVTATWPYDAFVDYETKCRNETDWAQLDDWWNCRSLAGEPTRFYRGSPANEGNQQQRETLVLNTEEVQQLDELAQRAPFRQLTPAMSLFNVFATALIAWLYRLNARREISIGATNHGRMTPQFRNTPGLFMQLLPFQIEVDGDDSFESLSRKVSREASGFLKYGVPGAMTPAMQKAFDVALNVIDLSAGDFAGMPTEMEWLHNGFGDAGRRLTVSVHRQRETGLIELIFDFSVEAFTSAEQARAMAHLRNVLSRMGGASTARLGDFDFLTMDEKVFMHENLGRSAERSKADVWDYFSQIVERYPGKTAITGIQGNYTYRQLKQTALVVHECLDAKNCGVVVPLLCRRDENAVIGMLGVLGSGRCFLPIDVDLPQARIEQLLQDSGAAWMLDVRADPQLLPIEACSNEGLDCDYAKKGCYVLYTSGSTGKPNGVVVGHESLINLLEAFESLAPVEHSNCSWWTNVGFDVAIYEVFTALLYGRTLCIPSERVRSSPEALFEWFGAAEIGNAYLPPFFLTAFNSFLATNTCGGIRRLLVGVEPIPQRLLASIAKKLPNLSLINGYGPTEATICTTLRVIDRLDHSDGPASIGSPVSGNVLRIVDANDCPTPPGVPGELLIGGAGLARGYLGNPGLTEKSFVHEECNGASVWYRTGDRVALRDDGGIQFLGRIDEQVKVRGHRIEPAEISSAILSYRGVLECAVIISDVAPICLWAFYTSSDVVTVSLLRRYLQERLPRYMVPARFLSVKTLPRTRNGKLDRSELLRIAHTSLDDPKEFVAATTALQSSLLAIWQGIFDRTGIGVTDNFFDLGGDSLDATRIAASAEKQGLHLAPGLLFKYQTIESLALVLNPEIEVEAVPKRDPLHLVSLPTSLVEKGYVKNEVADVYPLSPVQQAMLLHSLSSEDPGVYVTQVSCRLFGDLDIRDFKDAWQKVFERHSVLRTCFAWEDIGDPLQIVAKLVSIPWEVADWRSASPLEIDAQLDDYLKTDRARGFDLSEAPVARFLLVQESDASWRFIWSSHHLLLDGLSTLSILRDVWQELESIRTFQPLPRDSAVPFADYVFWVRDQDSSALEAFWKNELSGYDEPVDLVVHGGVHESGYQRLENRETSTLSQTLRSFAAAQRLTLSSIIHGAWALVLNAYTDKDDIVFGSTVSGRPSTFPEAERVIGCCINTLPIRLQIDPGVSPVAWLNEVQRRLVAIRDYEYAPLNEIQKWSDVPSSRSLFENIVVFESYSTDFASPSESSGLSMGELELRDQSNYPLVLLVYPNEKRLRYTLIFDSSRYSRTSIGRLLEHLSVVLTSLIDPKTHSLKEIELLAGDERQQVVSWSQKPALENPPDSVLGMIENNIVDLPDCSALVCDGVELSYGQLGERSDGLAAELVELGIRSGDRVGICLERSCEMIIGILGILKSGAAYVPIDPSFSELRREDMMAEAGVCAWVRRHELKAEGRIEVILLNPVDPMRSAEMEPMAYIIFTSGSTGRPKLVGVTHENLAFSTAARLEFYQQPVESFLLLSAYSFDSSVAGIFWTLCSGGVLVIPREGDEKNIERICALIATRRVTHTLCLPSIFSLLLQSSFTEGLQSLKTVIVAGETCPPQLAKQLYSMLPECQLYNEYGPTEATVWCSVHPVEAGSGAAGGVPIGKPIPGACIYVLNKQGALAPVGVAGEIWVAGPGVVSGYLGQLEFPEERFQKDKVSLNPEGRLYRTGDMGCWLENGNLCFLGRADGQVKVRGYRIELGEIETALQEHPGVATAVVVADRNEVDSSVAALASAMARLSAAEAEDLLGGGAALGRFREEVGGLSSLQRESLAQSLNERSTYSRLVAYVTLQCGDGLVDCEELKRFLEVRLPAYMVPVAIVGLEEIPKLPNGKIDRSKLPLPNLVPKVSESDNRLSELELQLRSIWRSVLGIDEISVEEDFFEIGGDSFLAMQLLVRIQNEFKLAPEDRLSSAHLLNFPTIARLAARLGEREDSVFECLVPIQKRSGSKKLFCTHVRGGQVIFYRNLSKYLPTLSVYGLQPVGVAGNAKPLECFEEMAGRYIADMRAVQPKGPYFIAGYCTGAALAFEVAKQLRESGDRVGQVILIDPTFHESVLKVKSFAPMRRFYRNYLVHGGGIGAVYAVLKDFSLFRLKCFKDAIAAKLGSTVNGEPTLEECMNKAFDGAFKKYALTSYLDSVVLVSSHETRIWDQYYRLKGLIDYWKEFVPNGEVISLDCRHTEIFDEPHIESLAQVVVDHILVE